MIKIPRRTLAWLTLIVALALPHSATAKGLLHTWTIEQETEAGHVFVPSGSAEGRGLSALLLADTALDGATPPEGFDAFIAEKMEGATNIHERIDMPRRPFNGKFILYTSMHFTNPKGDLRIAQFAAYAEEDATSLRIVWADGPHDTALMSHYADDVFEIAKRPQEAIAGTIELREHKVAAKEKPVAKAAPIKKSPKASPIRPSASLVKPNDSPFGGNNWTFKTFSDAVRWTVSDFNNVIGFKFYSITLYDPKPLNGLSVEDWLDAEAKAQEKYFRKTIQRDKVRTWRPFWVGLYKVYQNKDGDEFGAEYTALQVGPDSARMVRFLMTERDFYRKEYEDQNGAVREYMLKAANQAYIYPRIKAYQKQLDEERRERERLAAEEAERKRIAAEEEAERKLLEAEAQAKRNAELATRWTKPGKGLKLSDIEAITHHIDYQTSTMGGVDVTTTNWLLLKDGTAYSDPWIPPSDFNVEASRKVEPGRWDTWTKEGTRYYLGSGGKIPGSKASPGKERHVSLRGEYFRAWGGIGFGGGYTSRSMHLYSDGSFYNSASNLMSGAGAGAATVYSSKGPDGKTSVSSSADLGYLLNSYETSDAEGAANRGKYAIDGYTIEFLTDSGHRRRWIYFELYEGAARIGSYDYLETK